jgi:hypothetical protein
MQLAFEACMVSGDSIRNRPSGFSANADTQPLRSVTLADAPRFIRLRRWRRMCVLHGRATRHIANRAPYKSSGALVEVQVELQEPVGRPRHRRDAREGT